MNTFLSLRFFSRLLRRLVPAPRLVAGLMAAALWWGAAVFYTPLAQAADVGSPTQTEAYEKGPVRQSHNPVSKENYSGGVEPSATDQVPETARQSESEEGLIESIQDKGLIKTIQDKLPGGASAQQAPADLKTEKNPTLQRYTEEQQ